MIEVKEAGEGRFALVGEATVYTVADLHGQLCRHGLAGVATKVTVDLSGLTNLDIAGAQILIALRRTLGHARVDFTGCPEQHVTLLHRSGLEPHLF
jgi:ABC-type transporter Mla MlaB component